MNLSQALNRAPQPLKGLTLDNKVWLRYRVLWHCLFWLLFLLYEGLVWGTLDGEYNQRFTSSLIELPVKIIATYFTLYFLIDQFLLKGKYSWFVVLLLLSMMGFGVLLRMMAYYFIYPLYAPAAVSVPLFFPPKILIAIFVIYSVVAIVATFHLIRQWYAHQQANQLLKQAAQQLEKEKLEAELKLLKSQINPHFLFNTLNNLYVLTLNYSEKAPEIVYKLSQLMSYMLYDSNQPIVPLQKEMDYIENYITLEKIRYGERLDVSLNIYNQIECISIAPLLILPFIENSFKHGASSHLDRVWVRIDILLQENTLIIKVENNKGKSIPMPSLQSKSGLGLQNVKKRLDLIYKHDYSLQIFDEEDTYLVVLKIELQPEAIEEAELTS